MKTLFYRRTEIMEKKVLKKSRLYKEMYKEQTNKYVDQSYAKKLLKDEASIQHRKAQSTYLTMEFSM